MSFWILYIVKPNVVMLDVDICIRSSFTSNARAQILSQPFDRDGKLSFFHW